MNESHKEKIQQFKKEYNKQYYEVRKTMRVCSCGVEYNDGKTDCRNQHYRSVCVLSVSVLLVCNMYVTPSLLVGLHLRPIDENDPVSFQVSC